MVGHINLSTPQPPKRTAEDADATASSSSRNTKATKSQGGATAGQDASTEPSSSNNADGGEKQKETTEVDLYEYATFCQSKEYIKDQYREQIENEQMTEEDVEKVAGKCGGDCMCSKPASEHPDYPWVMMRGAMGKIIDDRDEVNFRNPESFGMYTFNDAAGYGIQEMIENMIVEINKSKVTKDKWIIFTRLVRLILDGEVTGWQMLEDGPRAIATYNVIGWGFLTMLAELERAGQLKRDSEYRDLGLVMIEYIRLGEEWEPYGFDEDGWGKKIVSYALKYNIDLAFTNFFKKDWESRRKQHGNPSELPDPTSKKNDPWDWKKKVKALESEYATPKTTRAKKGSLGGVEFDITKWSKKQRADAAYDHKDPIPADIIQALKRGERVGLA